MHITDSEAWESGFQAGQALARHCPYREGSQEEWDWHMAWLEGAAKHFGMRYSRTAAERAARLMDRPMAARPVAREDLVLC